jgi:ABC-type Fe3+ transport system permease subunit
MEQVMPMLRRRVEWNPLTVLASLAAALIAVPVVVVLTHVFMPAGDTWAHLASTVLPEYVANTLWLMVWVGGGVTVLGVATAWLTTACRFPGRGFFEWALILPLAMPAYVMAYAYTDFFQFTGPRPERAAGMVRLEGQGVLVPGGNARSAGPRSSSRSFSIRTCTCSRARRSSRRVAG